MMAMELPYETNGAREFIVKVDISVQVSTTA